MFLLYKLDLCCHISVVVKTFSTEEKCLKIVSVVIATIAAAKHVDVRGVCAAVLLELINNEVFHMFIQACPERGVCSSVLTDWRKAHWRPAVRNSLVRPSVKRSLP